MTTTNTEVFDDSYFQRVEIYYRESNVNTMELEYRTKTFNVQEIADLEPIDPKTWKQFFLMTSGLDGFNPYTSWFHYTAMDEQGERVSLRREKIGGQWFLTVTGSTTKYPTDEDLLLLASKMAAKIIYHHNR